MPPVFSSLFLLLLGSREILAHCDPGIPCFNGGTCVQDMDFQEPYCRCTQWWTGINCQIHAQSTRIRKTSLLCPNFFANSCPSVSSCVVDEDCNFGAPWSSPATCCRTRCGTHTCYGISNTARDLPLCVFDPWLRWSPCSVSCGGNGVMRRSREVRIGGGAPIPPEDAIGKLCQAGRPWDELRTCNNGDCPGTCVFTEWLAWSSCSSCNPGGTRIRKKQVISHGGPWPARMIVGRLCTAKEEYIQRENCPLNEPCFGQVLHFPSSDFASDCVDLHTADVCATRAAQGWCGFGDANKVYMGFNCCRTCRDRGFAV